MPPHPTLGRVAAGGRFLRPLPTIALAAAVVAAVAAGRRLTTYEIAEGSMEPALRAGDWVVALTRPHRISIGDVVVLEHPQRPGFDLVKRVTAPPASLEPMLDADTFWVTGDNPAAGSVDSTTFGPIRQSSIRARVLGRYAPLPPAPIARR